MRLRTFTAPNMPAAIELVRNALGENAIIIASEPLNNSKMVRVTAAIDPQDETSIPPAAIAREPHSYPTTPTIDHLHFELQNIFRFHNLPELFIAKLLQKITNHELASILAVHRIAGKHDQHMLRQMTMETLLHSYFNFEPLLFCTPDGNTPIHSKRTKGHRIMLIGLPGVGKTLAIAKLATQLVMDKKPVSIISMDTKRAGGIEQLQAFTSILDLELTVASSRTELFRRLKSLPTEQHALIDTAGCNAYDTAQLQELKSYASIEGVEPVLTMAAGGDSLEMVDIGEMFMTLPIRRLLITHTDNARRFGGVLSIAAAHELALSMIGYFSSVTEALVPANHKLLAKLLLQYQLKST